MAKEPDQKNRITAWLDRIVPEEVTGGRVATVVILLLVAPFVFYPPTSAKDAFETLGTYWGALIGVGGLVLTTAWGFRESRQQAAEQRQHLENEENRQRKIEHLQQLHFALSDGHHEYAKVKSEFTTNNWNDSIALSRHLLGIRHSVGRLLPNGSKVLASLMEMDNCLSEARISLAKKSRNEGEIYDEIIAQVGKTEVALVEANERVKERLSKLNAPLASFNID